MQSVLSLRTRGRRARRRRIRVDLLFERDQPDAAYLRAGRQFQQFAQGPTEVIEAHDTEGVALAGIIEPRQQTQSGLPARG
jgi:hypothetical protein